MSDKNDQGDRKRVLKNNFRELLGIEEKDVQNGNATLALPFNEQLLQGLGMIHGGVLSILIDSAVITAIKTKLKESETAMTIEMNINFLKPVNSGDLTAKGKVVRVGSTIAVGIGEIYNSFGELIATGRATCAVSNYSKIARRK